jgi:hypothetical protein
MELVFPFSTYLILAALVVLVAREGVAYYLWLEGEYKAGRRKRPKSPYDDDGNGQPPIFPPM